MNKYVVLFILIIVIVLAVAFTFTLMNVANNTNQQMDQILGFLIL